MLSNNASLIYGILMGAGARSAAHLIKRTSLSQPMISRALGELARHTEHLVIHRSGRQILYALTRQIRALPAAIPVYTVAAAPDIGVAHLLGTLSALQGGGTLFVAGEKSELLDGLPWFIQDMRPQGYIGRAFCRAQAQPLGLSDRLAEWSEDDVICALAALGDDTSGNLILGDAALQRYLSHDPHPPAHRSLDSLAVFFDRLAEAAVQGGAPGSSAAGEHPKFLTQYSTRKKIRHVIVKFSPLQDSSAAATRWQDLLIAEHIASAVLGAHGVAVPDTQIIISKKRCYLESKRFDRVGPKGRISTVTFAAIDNAFIGAHRNWGQSATFLSARGMIDTGCENEIHLLEAFGRLIGNTDMHFGNLSFHWEILNGQIKLRLAPIYDMLPMLYAPEKSEVTHRSFNPTLPESLVSKPSAAISMAQNFWARVAAHQKVSAAFREIACDNAALLAQWKK